MNIDEFRAMKAAEQESAKQTPPEQPVTPTTPPTEQVVVTPEPVVPVTPETKPVEQSAKILVDGKEYTADEVKAGFLRTEDYTRKTQEAARIRREAETAMRVYQSVAQNPQLVEQLGIEIPSEDSRQKQVLEDQLVQREVELMSIKYKDFNVQDVMRVAIEKNVGLEDAYLLNKSMSTSPVAEKQETSQLNIEDIKKQLRDELLKELESNHTATQTIITSNDTVTPTRNDNDIELTEAEKEYCRKSKTPIEVYKKDKLRLIKQRK